jgi:cytochrome c1/cytochrome c551/c552
MNRTLLLALAFSLSLLHCVSLAAESGGVVAGGDSQDGRLLLGELGCANCHDAAGGADWLINKPAPRLGQVAYRVAPDYLRAFLTDPHKTKPGTTMPSILHNLPQGERDETVDLLVHFLASQGEAFSSQPGKVDDGLLARGEALYHSVGCVACHQAYAAPPKHKLDPAVAAIRAADTPKPPTPAISVIPHGNLKAKTSLDALAGFIANPLHARPAGRMPNLGLQHDQAHAIAAYLLREQRKGEQLLPPQSTFKADPAKAKKGSVLFATIGCASCHDTSVLSDLQKLELPKLGATVAGFAAANNRSPGGEGPEKAIDGNSQTKYLNFGSAKSGLLIGLTGRPLIVGGLTLTSANDNPERDPASYLLEGSQDGKTFERIDTRKIPAFKKRFQPQTFEFSNVNPYKIYRLTFLSVRDSQQSTAVQIAEVELFASDPPKPGIESRLKAAPLAQVKAASAGNCLAAQPGKGRAQYDLSAKQRQATLAALSSWQQKQPLAAGKPAVVAQALLDHRMTVLRCYACHEREGKGGPESKLADYFAYEKVVDLGDEGRLPPRLDRIGAKLTTAGLKEMLHGGDRYRTYMATRMPRFGSENVDPLIAQFAAADAGKIPAYVMKTDKRLIGDGRTLVGKKTLACINCHAWGDQRLPGAEGLDLQRAAGRLQPAWFRAWLVDPQKLRRGTRMPTAWPDGKSFFAKIQKGDMNKQIDAIWSYLAAGSQGGSPSGLAPSDPSLLVPIDTPIVFRTFLQDVGAHAILVGSPNMTHVAFDANRVRMAQAWSGDFIGTKATWDGRAGQYAKVPSDKIVKLSTAQPFARLESNTAAWPKDAAKPKKGTTFTPPGYRFRGYRLDKKRVPTFLYTALGLAVEETPRADFNQITRHFQLTPRADVVDLYFRAASGKKIVRDGDKFVVDEQYTYQISGGDQPLVRSTDGGQELIVPLRFTGKKPAVLDITVSW